MQKYGAMEQVAHQCIAMQYLLELAKQLDLDPRACISSFFTKIQLADPEYKKAFEDELAAFKERIRKRAKEKVEEQMEEIRKEEERERQERLGPGGLDPVEVFDSLPEVSGAELQPQDGVPNNSESFREHAISSINFSCSGNTQRITCLVQNDPRPRVPCLQAQQACRFLLTSPLSFAGTSRVLPVAGRVQAAAGNLPNA